MYLVILRKQKADLSTKIIQRNPPLFSKHYKIFMDKWHYIDLISAPKITAMTVWMDS